MRVVPQIGVRGLGRLHGDYLCKTSRQNRREESDPGIKIKRKSPRNIVSHDTGELINQKSVYLKEGTSAHPIGSQFCLVDELSCSKTRQAFRLSGLVFRRTVR